MSKTVKVSLTSSKSKKALSLDDKFISLGKGKCIFPFNYNETEYNECYPGKKGDWCATEVYPSGNMKKYAYCDYTTPSPTKTKKNNGPGPGPTKTKKNNAGPGPGPGPTKTKKNNAGPQAPTKTKKLKFKVQEKFVPDTVEKRFLISDHKSIKPKVWELPNRKTFPKWFNKEFKTYIAKGSSMKVSSTGFDLFNHQNIVRDYLNSNSPYRGILLYHGLGVGKTCASIAIAEGFRTNRDIIILLNKSLVTNFRVNLMKCGFEMFRIKQHWVFHDFTDPKDPMISYANYLKMPNSIIKKAGGSWFVDFTKTPNYDSLTGREQQSLNEQIEAMIDSKYEFIHIDGINTKLIDTMIKTKKFDNKLIIVDEVHNITNAMSKPFPGIRGKGLKQLMMEAENLKLVFLSGTPMINNLFESAQLFNLLRGYIHNFQYTLIRKSFTKISYDEMVEKINQHTLVDQVLPKKSDKVINVVRNPRGFITAPTNDGVIASTENDITDDEFKSVMKALFRENNYDISLIVNKYTALPDNEDEFMSLFYNESKNKIKNPMLYQSRIMGLVSYFSTQDKSLLPTVTVNDVVEVPMSKYQFLAYSVIRKEEIDQDKSKKQEVKPKGKSRDRSNSKKSESDNANLFDDKKSSYRAYSRMHCSFVFPESIPRPYKSFQIDDKELSLWLKGVEEDLKRIFRKSEIKDKNIDSIIDIIKDKITDINNDIEEETHDSKENTSMINIRDELEVKLGELISKKHELTIELDELDEESEKPMIEQSESTPSTTSASSKAQKKAVKDYEKSKVKVLKELHDAKDTLFTLDDPEQLLKYSPKYNQIIKKCNEINGLSFIYTEYKTLEGIATLKICLEANGYAPFTLKEVSKGKYSIDIPPENKAKPKFAFWGGNQEESDIIRKIFNNQFDELPTNIREQLEKMYPGKNNIRGDVIKILLTTKSGAEGIDLQNVRQVHIVEPYWNPVRTEQVKGRAVRVGSHMQLPAKDRTVEIYTYLSTIKMADLKTDLTMLDDKGGMTSDQVLFEISQKKLEVMNDFLRLIKETSFDCNINLNETRSKDNYFECLTYGTTSRDDYSFGPNVRKEYVDTERKRRVKVSSIEYVFKKIKMMGKSVTFAVLLSKLPDGKNILYDAEMAKVGDAGEPLGEYLGESATKITPYDVKRLKDYIKSF